MIGCKALNNEEIQVILNGLNNIRDKALFILNLYTGFRIQESLSLTVQDVYQNGSIVDRITVARKNMKGKVASRSVILHIEVKKALEALIVQQGLEPHHFLFKSQKGNNKPLGRIQAWKILNAVVEANNLQGKIALHSTRKTFADKMYNRFQKDLIKTSKALGHRNIMSTVSYLSFKTEELDEAILSQ